ncbi:nucleotidyltransferase [Leifsonia sp. NPDC056665]|uniref:SMODS domain-containing nucleotidyltransferase n=1 Tax=Leifsonia sp. NPDC056665 TaxID=3345901 RepID=UPI00369E6FE9
MATGFEAAASAVEPQEIDKSAASRAHLEVRKVLESDRLLASWGINSVLIGSYKRRVSIRRIKDVDVFCRLEGIPDDVSGAKALDEFYRVLVSAYGEDFVTRQARSMSVEAETWDGLHVDAVPARAAGAYWEIPDRSDPSAGWQETNPEGLTELSSTMNTAMGDLYVPAVKLIRQTRRTLIGDHPGGLFAEVALYRACERGLVHGNTMRDFFVSALQGVSQITDEKVLEGAELPDPTRPGNYLAFRATDEEWALAAEAFRTAAAQAERARTAPRCAAEATFHRLLGKNSDGETVYPLPADCNADGTTKSRLVAGDRTVPGGNQKFA